MTDIFGGEEIEQLEQEARTAEEGSVEDEPEAKVEEVEEVEETEEEEKEVPTVPLSALNEARAQSRQLQSELQSLKQQVDQFQTLKQQMDEWRKTQQGQQQEQEFNTDPLGALRKQNEALQQQIEELVASQTKGREEAQTTQQLQQQVSAYVQSFREQQPLYDDALQYVMQGRAKELEAWGMPAHEAQAALEQEANALAQQALQSGQNPAELVWRIAQARGFQAKPKPPKVESIQRGQKASQSLPSGSAEEVSLTDISKMSDEEFDKFWDDMERSVRSN